MVAKAVANESQVNFISVKGPELISKYLGESERGIREIFKKAKQAAQTIIFFDEIDALVPIRGIGGGPNHTSERVISQFLTELDGIEELKGVVVIGATNRLDTIDPAIIRPGIFDLLLGVPIPDEATRLIIFQIHTKGKPLDKDVNLEQLSKITDKYTGAEIEAIARKASMLSIREYLNKLKGKPNKKDIEGFRIKKKHFEEAMKLMKQFICSNKEIA